MIHIEITEIHLYVIKDIEKRENVILYIIHITISLRGVIIFNISDIKIIDEDE